MADMFGQAKGNSINPGVNSKRIDTKRLATLAILAAIAYAIMVVGRIPIVMFLKYDPKDVVIAIAGFIYGPWAALMISVVVSFIEMITVSDTGPWGLLMNILSTCAFICPAAYIYKKNRTIKSAVIGLIIGAVAMTSVMLLWNYLITPIYMGYPRQAVADLLIPVFLPFNAFKAGLNATITILLYKPVVGALRKAKLVPEAEDTESNGANKKWLMIITLFAFATVVVLGFVLAGVI